MNMTKTALLPACLLLASLDLLAASTIAWWRLDETAPPIVAAEGGPNLKWWVQKEGEYVASSEVPPSSLYRQGVGAPLNSFDAGQSYADDVRGLISEPGGDFFNTTGGLTVEGFFKTSKTKPNLERQALVSCGEGFADMAWIVRLIDGKPTFAVFQGTGNDPVAAVEVADDVRDERWYFFAARVVPGEPARLKLTIRAEGEDPQSEEVELPAGVSVRPNRKPLIIGRSSLYIDNKPEYAGTWDTLAGQIADVRISAEALPDEQLLGALRR